MTLLATYTYVATRVQWCLMAVTTEHGSVETLSTKRRFFDHLADLERFVRSEVPAATAVVLQRYDPCDMARHTLETALFRYWSSDGRIAFVRCGCGRPREIRRDVWLFHHPKDGEPVGVEDAEEDNESGLC